MVANERHDAGAERGARGSGIADEDNAARSMSRRIDELPEVLVFGEQKTTFPYRILDDPVVLGSGDGLGDRQDIESFGAQRAYRREVTTFVREEAQHGPTMPAK